jgi:hypothetical protein
MVVIDAMSHDHDITRLQAWQSVSRAYAQRLLADKGVRPSDAIGVDSVASVEHRAAVVCSDGQYWFAAIDGKAGIDADIKRPRIRSDGEHVALRKWGTVKVDGKTLERRRRASGQEDRRRAPLEEERSARRVHSQPLKISEGDRVATVLAEPVPAWWEKQRGTTPRQRRDSPLDTGTSVIGIWESPMIND